MGLQICWVFRNKSQQKEASLMVSCTDDTIEYLPQAAVLNVLNIQYFVVQNKSQQKKEATLIRVSCTDGGFS